MAVTFTVTAIDGTVNTPQVMGQFKVAVVKIALAGTYTTGGDALTPARLGLSKVHGFIPMGMVEAAGGTTGNIASYDYATNKLQLFESGASGAAPAEKTSAEAVITDSFVRAMVIGV